MWRFGEQAFWIWGVEMSFWTADLMSTPGCCENRCRERDPGATVKWPDLFLWVHCFGLSPSCYMRTHSHVSDSQWPLSSTVGQLGQGKILFRGGIGEFRVALWAFFWWSRYNMNLSSVTSVLNHGFISLRKWGLYHSPCPNCVLWTDGLRGCGVDLTLLRSHLVFRVKGS